MDEREIQLINAFVIPSKRERYATFLASAKRRPKILRALDHFHDLNPAYMVHVEGRLDSPTGVVTELRRRGAPEQCYLISSNVELDGVTLALEEAVVRVHCGFNGTFIGCIPGVLAYYEGEAPKNRFILDVRSAKGRGST